MKKKIKELKDLFAKRGKGSHSPEFIDALVKHHNDFIIDSFISGMSPLDLYISFPQWDEIKI